MKKRNDFDSLDEPSLIKRMIPVFAAIIIVVFLVAILLLQNNSKNKKASSKPNSNTSVTNNSTNDKDNPDDPENEMSNNGTGSTIDISQILSTGDKTKDTTYGIDVSKYQGTIDWAQVAASGIDFAMI